LDSENRAVVISKGGGEALAQQTLDVSDDEAKLIVEAAESCPMIAISVHDASGAQIYG
jgi:ferredoxin